MQVFQLDDDNFERTKYKLQTKHITKSSNNKTQNLKASPHLNS